MKLCGIEIHSEGDGWKSTVRAIGSVVTTDGVKFGYEVEGDECTLSYKDGKVTQVRRGDQNIIITFEEGKTTCCKLSSGGFTGSYDVFTRRIQFVDSDGGYRLFLDYLNGTEPVTLTFTADCNKTQANHN